MILAGYTFGDWNTRNAGDADFAAAKIDAFGNPVWIYQVRSMSTAVGSCFSCAMHNLPCGEWIRAFSWDVCEIVFCKGGYRICHTCMHHNGQDGTNEVDSWNTAAAGDNGTIILAGYTAGAWNGLQAGSKDFAAVMLYADKTEKWRWQVFIAQQ